MRRGRMVKKFFFDGVLVEPATVARRRDTVVLDQLGFPVAGEALNIGMACGE
jgi:hypothetical protein